MTFSVIIVSHNGIGWIEKCIQSVKRQRVQAEIIVVDNASADGTLEYLKSERGISLVESKTNIGFAAGTNMGASKASGEYLLLLNQDARLDDLCLLNLTGSTEDILQLQVMDYDSFDYQSIGSDGIDIFGMPTRIHKPTVCRIFSGYGCAMAVKRESWEKLGGFDESFGMYCEETDLCWRAHLIGMSVVAKTLSWAHHRKADDHGSSVWKRYMSVRNGIKMVRKNGNVPMVIGHCAVISAEAVALLFITRNWSLFHHGYMRGIEDGLHHPVQKSPRTIPRFGMMKFIRLMPARIEEIARFFKHGIPKMT
jgi:GT2 family glycosyltransferase